MTYLQKLIKDKESSTKYNEEVERLKFQIKLINDNYSLYDGEYLEALEKFNKEYK